MTRRTTRLTRLTAGVLAPALVMLAGCTGEDPDKDSGRVSGGPALATGVDPAWYAAVEQEVADADQVGAIPVLSRGECPLPTPRIAGEELDDDPDVGVSTLGDSGERLVCRWSPPSTDVVVTRFDDPAELELARAEVSEVGEVDNGDNVRVTEAITLGERELFVRRTTYPTNDTHISYSAWYLDDEKSGLVLLDVDAGETRDLIETYDSQQAAEDLAALLG